VPKNDLAITAGFNRQRFSFIPYCELRINAGLSFDAASPIGLFGLNRQ
jgi:hypothetical protein